jgi:lambda repressor-like predicted transcriptional regulator
MHPAEIKAALEIAGYSQADLARELEINRSLVSAVVAGHSRSKKVEDRIAEIIRRPAAEIWPQWHGERPLLLSSIERELVQAFRAAAPAAQRRALRNLGAGSGDEDVAYRVTADRGGIAAGRDAAVHAPKSRNRKK